MPSIHAIPVDAPSAPGRRFRLATFNIHGGKGGDRHIDLARTARCLERAQFAALNEVHGTWLWESANQVELIARQVQRDCLFAPTEQRWWHYEFGNAALSALPIRSWQRIPLARHHGKSFRNVVRLTADVDGRPLNLLVTHLDRSNDRERTDQLRAVTGMFLALATPAVLMGDLNTTADDPAIAPLLQTSGVNDPLKPLPAEHSCGRIDWILTRGLRCFDRGATDIGASDHPCYWVDCAIEPAPKVDGTQ